MNIFLIHLRIVSQVEKLIKQQTTSEDLKFQRQFRVMSMGAQVLCVTGLYTLREHSFRGNFEGGKTGLQTSASCSCTDDEPVALRKFPLRKISQYTRIFFTILGYNI